MSRIGAGATGGLDGDGQHERTVAAARGQRRLAQAAGAPRQAAAAPGEDDGAPRVAARGRGARGGCRRRARRSGSRRDAATRAKRWCSNRSPPADGARASPATAARRAARAQARSVRASVRTRRGGKRGGEDDGRTGATQRGSKLGVGGTQTGGRAERDDQDVHPPIARAQVEGHQVTAPLVGSGRRALKPGVRCRAIGCIGEVRRT